MANALTGPKMCPRNPIWREAAQPEEVASGILRNSNGMVVKGGHTRDEVQGVLADSGLMRCGHNATCQIIVKRNLTGETPLDRAMKCINSPTDTCQMLVEAGCGQGENLISPGANILGHIGKVFWSKWQRLSVVQLGPVSHPDKIFPLGHTEEDHWALFGNLPNNPGDTASQPGEIHLSERGGVDVQDGRCRHDMAILPAPDGIRVP